MEVKREEAPSQSQPTQKEGGMQQEESPINAKKKGSSGDDATNVETNFVRETSESQLGFEKKKSKSKSKKSPTKESTFK